MPKSAAERVVRNKEREEIVKRAYEACKPIIIAGSDGSDEETDFLWGMLAKCLNDQTYVSLKYQMLRYDIVGHIVSE